MDKKTFSLLLFILDIALWIVFYFSFERLAFAFALMFALWFSIDSFVYMIKGRNSNKGVVMSDASQDNSLNK